MAACTSIQLMSRGQNGFHWIKSSRFSTGRQRFSGFKNVCTYEKQVHKMTSHVLHALEESMSLPDYLVNILSLWSVWPQNQLITSIYIMFPPNYITFFSLSPQWDSQNISAQTPKRTWSTHSKKHGETIWTNVSQRELSTRCNWRYLDGNVPDIPAIFDCITMLSHGWLRWVYH